MVLMKGELDLGKLPITSPLDLNKAFAFSSAMWTYAFGSREQKATSLSYFIPIKVLTKEDTGGIIESISSEGVINKIITAQKKDPKLKTYWGEAVLGTTDIPAPDILKPFADLPKYMLYGLIGIAGIYLIGKYIGRK